MITPSTKSIAQWLFCGCAAISGGHGLWELLTGQWLESSLHLAGAGFVLFMGWCMQLLEGWEAALQREAEAKACFAELLLAKMRDTDGMGIQIGVDEIAAKRGTRH